MPLRSFAPLLFVLCLACSHKDTLAPARASLKAGDLASAEGHLAGQKGPEADALRAQILEARKHRAEVSKQADALRAQLGERDADEIRAQLRSLKDQERDKAIGEHIDGLLAQIDSLTSNPAWRAKAASSGEPEPLVEESASPTDMAKAREQMRRGLRSPQPESAASEAPAPLEGSRTRTTTSSTPRALPRDGNPPPESTADELVKLARDSVQRGDLAFASQCWLAASRKVQPGNLRDDYVGEAVDLRARIELRDELSGAFRSQRSRLAPLGLEQVTPQGWVRDGKPKGWHEITLDEFHQVSDAVELSRMAKRGVLCEVLASGSTFDRDRALAELARLSERGEIDSADAANIVARARGGLGASERVVLDKGNWSGRAQVAAADRAAEDARLEKLFLRAGKTERDAAFDELVSGATKETAEKALRERSEEAVRAVAKSRTLDQLKDLAALRTELDQARKNALALIFDEKVYFYPYDPPPAPLTAGDYARAQHQVDELVGAVRDVWARSKVVKPAKEFAEALEELEWCRAAQGELKLDLPLPESVPAYALVQDATLEKIELGSFAWDADEARKLAYDRAVIERNEKLWIDVDSKQLELAADALPNVAEREQVRITNRYRVLMGRRAVAWNPKIQAAAQGHSEYMANTGDFGHDEKGDPKRRGPGDRMRLAGYTSGVSENCAMVGGDPQAAHDGWLHSSGHHRNILMPGHREMASGSASNYWTQNFGTGTAFEKELGLAR